MRKKSLYLGIIILVASIDQFTKYLIIAKMPLYTQIDIFPCLNIVHIRNIGAAFGMFKWFGNNLFTIISSIALVVIIALIVKGDKDLLSLSLIAGGATGNLIDRLTRGYVVDFIDVYAGKYHWPAFNVADSSLSIGITLLILGQIGVACRIKKIL